jgi:hypothetical protein
MLGPVLERLHDEPLDPLMTRVSCAITSPIVPRSCW